MTASERNAFDHLTRRQVVSLLEKAVMDNRISDVVLFGYEAGASEVTELMANVLVPYMREDDKLKPFFIKPKKRKIERDVTW